MNCCLLPLTFSDHPHLLTHPFSTRDLSACEKALIILISLNSMETQHLCKFSIRHDFVDMLPHTLKRRVL